MVSLVQVTALQEYEKLGWYGVSSSAPFTMETPIGGPTYMMNSKNEMIIVYADGSAAYVGPVKPYNDHGRESSYASRICEKP